MSFSSGNLYKIYLICKGLGRVQRDGSSMLHEVQSPLSRDPMRITRCSQGSPQTPQCDRGIPGTTESEQHYI